MISCFSKVVMQHHPLFILGLKFQHLLTMLLKVEYRITKDMKNYVEMEKVVMQQHLSFFKVKIQTFFNHGIKYQKS